jgi:urease accessory protein UreH
MGERDAYRWLDLRCRVMVDNRPVLVERSSLEPRTRSLTNPARAGAFDCVGSLFLVGFGPLDLAAGERGPDLWWQAGGSETVTMVRYLGTKALIVVNAQEAMMATAWRSE